MNIYSNVSDSRRTNANANRLTNIIERVNSEHMHVQIVHCTVAYIDLLLMTALKVVNIYELCSGRSL